MHTFGVDENDIIITEVSFNKITPAFKPILDNVLHSVLREFEPDLDSIYLYGSVATGKAVLGKSDMDTILVFKEKPSEELTERVSNLSDKLSKENEPALRGVGLEVTCVEDVLSEKERYGGMCFMKHLCICVYGKDLAKDVPGFKPSKEVAKGFNGDIRQSLESSKAKIARATSKEEINKLSQSISKKVIRTGFSLVMPRAKSWTTDLQTSTDAFTKFYPERAAEMSTAFEWSKSGISDKEIIIEFLDTFGQWLIEEFETQILTD